MTTSSLLTVAIPTWNRNVQVETTLKALTPQLRPSVCVLLVDNCSDKPIEESICASLRNHVRIVRNPLNIGAPANILRCLELANSDWIWILGDDDEPTPNAIDRVLQEIADHHDCCLLDFGHPIGRPRSKPIITHTAKDAINAMYYSNGKPELFTWSDGHISNEILNRSLLNNRIRSGYQYAYTWYPHVAMLFSALSDGLPCLFTGPQLALPRLHEEAPNSYMLSDIAKGWTQLAEVITDTEARQRYLAAINSSGIYGEKLILSQSISKKVYQTVVPKCIRSTISGLRHS